MSNRERIEMGVVLCLFIGAIYFTNWRVMRVNQRIVALETRMSLVESNATETLTAAQSVQADLAALRKAILASMTTNMTARPLPPGTPKVITP